MSEKTTRMSYRYPDSVGRTLQRLEKRFNVNTFSDVLNRIATEYEETQTQLHLKKNQLAHLELQLQKTKRANEQLLPVVNQLIGFTDGTKSKLKKLIPQLKKLSK